MILPIPIRQSSTTPFSEASSFQYGIQDCHGRKFLYPVRILKSPSNCSLWGVLSLPFHPPEGRRLRLLELGNCMKLRVDAYFSCGIYWKICPEWCVSSIDPMFDKQICPSQILLQGLHMCMLFAYLHYIYIYVYIYIYCVYIYIYISTYICIYIYCI